jgi:hypothetical protein
VIYPALAHGANMVLNEARKLEKIAREAPRFSAVAGTPGSGAAAAMQPPPMNPETVVSEFGGPVSLMRFQGRTFCYEHQECQAFVLDVAPTAPGTVRPHSRPRTP